MPYKGSNNRLVGRFQGEADVTATKEGQLQQLIANDIELIDDNNRCCHFAINLTRRPSRKDSADPPKYHRSTRIKKSPLPCHLCIGESRNKLDLGSKSKKKIAPLFSSHSSPHLKAAQPSGNCGHKVCSQSLYSPEHQCCSKQLDTWSLTDEEDLMSSETQTQPLTLKSRKTSRPKTSGKQREKPQPVPKRKRKKRTKLEKKDDKKVASSEPQSGRPISQKERAKRKKKLETEIKCANVGSQCTLIASPRTEQMICTCAAVESETLDTSSMLTPTRKTEHQQSSTQNWRLPWPLSLITSSTKPRHRPLSRNDMPTPFQRRQERRQLLQDICTPSPSRPSSNTTSIVSTSSHDEANISDQVCSHYPCTFNEAMDYEIRQRLSENNQCACLSTKGERGCEPLDEAATSLNYDERWSTGRYTLKGAFNLIANRLSSGR